MAGGQGPPPTIPAHPKAKDIPVLSPAQHGGSDARFPTMLSCHGPSAHPDDTAVTVDQNPPDAPREGLRARSSLDKTACKRARGSEEKKTKQPKIPKNQSLTFSRAAEAPPVLTKQGQCVEKLLQEGLAVVTWDLQEIHTLLGPTFQLLNLTHNIKDINGKGKQRKSLFAEGKGKEMYSGEGNGNVEVCSAIRAAAKNMAVLSSPLQEDLTVLPLPAATTFCSAHSAGPERRNALCPLQGTARLALSCRDGRAQTGKASTDTASLSPCTPAWIPASPTHRLVQLGATHSSHGHPDSHIHLGTRRDTDTRTGGYRHLDWGIWTPGLGDTDWGTQNVFPFNVRVPKGGTCGEERTGEVTPSDQRSIPSHTRPAQESNNSDINKHDAILERNATVKQEKTKILKKNLGKKLPSDAEALHKDDLVYTVSSREYWKGHTLSKDETEIPKLREYAQTFYVAQKKNKLMDHVREALVIFSLVQSLRSNQDAQHPPVTGRQPSDLLLRRVADLEGDIKKCFVPMEQPLEDGVVQAKKLYDKCIHKIFNRVHGNRGFHKTLKAVCLKKGVYASPTFCRIDINDSLAQPIYEKIDMSFGNIFRIQMGTRSTLKACLDVFKDAMKQQLRTAMTGCRMADKEDKLKFLEQETEFITGETEKLILQKKAEIYQSLTVSIQNDLLPCYAEAASQRGAHACKRMQTILSEGIKTELGKGMFERAQASMRSHFQDLKVGIIRKMKKDFSDMLSLVFCPWNQLSSVLPDLQNEFSFIHTIQENLSSWLHQRKCGQHVNEGDSAPGLHSGGTLPAIQCAALETHGQERHGPVGGCSEEGHKSGQMDGTPLL
ncbi:uncharacterized protein O3Q21_002210 [Podargus strigoides]